MSDMVVRGGTLITPSGRQQADLAVTSGVIATIGPDLGTAREEIDARGLVVLPGLIDVHLHFNEPGRTEWEGAATGSRGRRQAEVVRCSAYQPWTIETLTEAPPESPTRSRASWYFSSGN